MKAAKILFLAAGLEAVATVLLAFSGETTLAGLTGAAALCFCAAAFFLSRQASERARERRGNDSRKR